MLVAVQTSTACSSDNGTSTSGAAGAANAGGGRGGAISGSAGAAEAGGSSSEAGSAGESGAADVPAPAGDRRTPYTPMNDAQFAAFFAEHHRMAIDMAKMEAKEGASVDAKALATTIVNAQTMELSTLETALAELNQGVPPASPADPHAEADMAAMSSLAGVALDKMFLMDMIAHHAAGLAPARRALANLQRPDLVALAKAIFSKQSEEIGTMRQMLTVMGSSDAGEDLAASATGRADYGFVGDPRITLTPDSDVTFIDFFVPHHRAAIAMAKEEIARGASSDVVAMATMMRDAQMTEVDTMTASRKALTGIAEPTAPPDDPVMMAQMAMMKTLSGANLDQMFLELMIPHHGSALPTSHRAKPHLKRVELQVFADKMFVAQGEEIGAMNALLGKN